MKTHANVESETPDGETKGRVIVAHRDCLFQCHPNNVIYQAATAVDEFTLSLQAAPAPRRMI